VRVIWIAFIMENKIQANLTVLVCHRKGLRKAIMSVEQDRCQYLRNPIDRVAFIKSRLGIGTCNGTHVPVCDEEHAEEENRRG
jgi:hypothetical protein